MEPASSRRRGLSARPIAALLVLLPALWSGAPAISSARQDLGHCLVLDVRDREPVVSRALAVPGLEAWLRLDTDLFACGSQQARSALSELAPVVRDLGPLERSRLRLAHGLHRTEIRALGLRLLAEGGRFAVVELPESVSAAATEETSALLPFVSGRTLARPWEASGLRGRSVAALPAVSALVDEVDPLRWFDDVTRLAAYNRYSNGSEIGDAGAWIRQQLRRLPGLEVESHEIAALGGRAFNVTAVLPGRSRPDDWYILGGHYDSTSETPATAAPGAEDNASGCAGVLELARIFSAHPPEATLVFICYAGEEQGLLGSRQHASRLVAAGDAEKVRGVVSLDMIGFTSDDRFGCVLESDSTGQGLVEAFAQAAEAYTSLRVVTSIHPFLSACCSDHVPYSQGGMPALLAIEDDWSLYPHYHRSTDLPEHLTPEMAEQILRMTAGAVARAAVASDLSGCVESDGEPVTGASAVLRQNGERKKRSRSGPRGCFAFDDLAEGKAFRFKLRGPRVQGDAASVVACVQLLGEPLVGAPFELLQGGASRQRAVSDRDGCATFSAQPGSRFRLTIRGRASR